MKRKKISQPSQEVSVLEQETPSQEHVSSKWTPIFRVVNW